jgi:predicted nuclease with TOPRIM domain
LHQVNSEVQAIKAALTELKSMHQQVAQLVSGLPAELQAVRAAIPTLDAVESKLSEIKAFGSKFDQLDEISTKLDHLPEIKGSLDALPSHFPKLDDNLVRADFDKLAAQLEALNEIKGTLAALPSQMPKMDEGVAKSKDLEKLFAQLGELSEIKDKLEALPSQMPKMDEGLAKSQDFEKLFTQLSELGEIKDKLEALPSKLPKLDAGLAKSHDLEKLSSQLAELKEIKNKLEELPAQMPNLGENLADFQNSLKQQIEGLNGKIDESGANLVELITSNADDEATDKKRGKKGKGQKEDEPAALDAPSHQVEVTTAPASPKPDVPTGEFSFNNAIRQMNEEGQEQKKKDEDTSTAPATFKLGELPDKLDTFEDSGPEAVLPTMKVDDDDESAAADKEAVELLLMELTAINKPNQDDDEFDAVEDVPLDLESEDGSRWSGLGGSSSRSWSSHSSRPLELVAFEGELKPITPIETAPSGDPIGAVAFGFGRVLYSCGLKIHGFWPGREGRSIVMDHPIPTDDWRLATNGQSLFVAEPKKVKIVSLQGWFVLEQFNGEYYDQMVTKSHWVGIRNDKGAVMDIRNHRGQPIGEGINLGTGLDGLKICGHGNRIFAGSAESVVSEVTELGTERLGVGPEGARCMHLTFAEGAPLAILKVGDHLEAWHFGDKVRNISLETSSYSGVPMMIGSCLYLADVDNHTIVSLDVKKMALNKVPAFQGVTSLRRVLGVHHKGQHTMFAITTDEGKRGGRLVSVDAKTGWETTFCLVGQASVNLITADHHLVISTSNQYQNLVRVLEPFQLKAAA